MNMMNSVPANLSPALAHGLEEARKKLELAEARKREAIAEALLPKSAKAPQAKPHHPVAKLPPPPMARPKLVACKDDKCELPGKLFAPAKVTYKFCPACSLRRKQEAEANRQAEQQARAQIHEMERAAEKTEQLLADFHAGKAFACTDEGCLNIERPGPGYVAGTPFHCFQHREMYRASRALGHAPMHPKQPKAVVIEDTATQARKRAKLEAEELFKAGGEPALPKGVSLHQRLDRQITLKFMSGGESFYHNFVMPIDQAAKRAQDEAAKKRRHENRQRIDDAPKKGGHKSQKKESKKGRK